MYFQYYLSVLLKYLFPVEEKVNLVHSQLSKITFKLVRNTDINPFRNIESNLRGNEMGIFSIWPISKVMEVTGITIKNKSKNKHTEIYSN